MALFHITIEKVIVQDDDREIKKKLNQILCLLAGSQEDEELKTEIMAKLEKAIADIKSTIN